MRIPIVLILSLVSMVSACAGRDYFVDCARGSDAAAGDSQAAAWKSLEKVSATTFLPGDSILLRRGTRCSGSLAPKGSGEEGRPIRISAYGNGPLPVIEAGAAAAAIKLFDQQHWEIENLETAGGSPYGVLVSGASGTLRHFRLRNLVIHDVSGVVKTKASGLLVVLGTPELAIQDVVIDGVTAYNTTQWAGIIVHGGSRENRIRNVAVRNSIVHDVYGDGIVLFNVEDGLIEKSAAWLTGLQPVETIGTPNGIWTWRCRRCAVRLTEGFFTDSPGVDGGVYDIDWGNDDNFVERNYGHDAQGYCASVFGAEKEVTTNSVIRKNVCVNNGRSPKLARRQGDLYISTWDGGALDGVIVEKNIFVWNPPIDAPVVQMDQAEFTGKRPNVFAENIVTSAVPTMIHTSRHLEFKRNVWLYSGKGTPKWIYGDKVLGAFEGYGADSEARVREALRSEQGSQPPSPASSWAPRRPGRWQLVLLDGPDARSQLVFLQTALAQYGDGRLEAAVAFPEAPENIAADWNLGAVRVIEGAPHGPGLLLISPAGQVIRHWDRFAEPAELGLALKLHAGAPAGSPALTVP